MSNTVYRISHKVKNVPPPLTRAVVADFFTSEGDLSEEGLDFIQSTYLCVGAISKKDKHLIIKIAPQGKRLWSRTKGRPVRICLLCSPDDLGYGHRRIDRFSRHGIASIHRANIAELLDISESKLPGMRLYPCDKPQCRRPFPRLDQLHKHKKICGQVVPRGSRTAPAKLSTPPPQLGDASSAEPSSLSSPPMEQRTLSAELDDAISSGSCDYSKGSQACEASHEAPSTEYVDTAEQLYRYYFDRYICYPE